MMRYPDGFPLELFFPDMQPEVREEDGIYTYTFTPAINYPDPVLSGDGILAKSEIDQWLQRMHNAAKKTPQYLFVSPETYWSIKRARLSGVNHLPRRKMRKCFLRKRQARIEQGKRHLLRCQWSQREPERTYL